MPEFAVTVTEALTPEERSALFSWSDDIWSVRRLNIEWRPATTHLVGRVDGVPVSHAGILSFRHELPSGPVTIGGIGAVLCLPDHRGKGYASRTVTAATECLRDRFSCDAASLFCFDHLVPFYGRLGFEVFPDDVTILQQSGRKSVPDENFMVHRFHEIDWPHGPLHFTSRPW